MRMDMAASVESMTGSVDPDCTEWDVIVIGGGPPGENAAAYASDGSGLSAVIVEQELVGGECSYWACMPSKALLRPVEVLDTARKLPGAQQALDGRTVDVAAVLARRDAFTSHHDDSSQVQWANGAGIDIVRGRGRLTG
jgi:pyruvate/2-oxoglutarate dehydrogenase complex dihydrolipoamide dehydrogenase (E3) component